jgi:hypothetical protein
MLKYLCISPTLKANDIDKIVISEEGMVFGSETSVEHFLAHEKRSELRNKYIKLMKHLTVIYKANLAEITRRNLYYYFGLPLTEAEREALKSGEMKFVTNDKFRVWGLAHVIEKCESLYLDTTITSVRLLEHLKLNSKTSKMKYLGPSAGGVSWNGLATDILKSALQKYIRRGDYKAMWVITELDLFSELLINEIKAKGDKVTGLKALQTNIFNRLVVITVEDVGIGNVYLPIAVDQLWENWKEVRFSESARTKRMEMIQRVTYALMKAPKARMISHLRAVYFLAPKMKNFKSKIKSKYPNIYGFSTKGDPVTSFMNLYNARSDACFYWFFKLLFPDSKDGKADKPAVKKLIDFIIKEEKRNHHLVKLFETLRKWAKELTNKESWMPLAELVLAGLRFIPHKKEEDFAAIQDKSFNNNLQYLVNTSGIKIKIDDFCVDKHTRKGKRSGKGDKDFVEEGSVVFNESPLVRDDYKAIYSLVRRDDKDEVIIPRAGWNSEDDCNNNSEKKVIKITDKGDDNPTKTNEISVPDKTDDSVNELPTKLSKEDIDNLTNLKVPRGQIITSKSKRHTYMPQEGKFYGFVFKGPWQSAKYSAKIDVIRFRSEIIRRMNASAIQVSVLEDYNGDYWLTSRNLSKIDPKKWVLEEKQGSLEPVPIKTVNRESLGYNKASKVAESKMKELMFGERMMFNDFMLVALLGVGDMSLANVLFNGERAYIIDYDDNSSRTSISSPNEIFAHPRSKGFKTLIDNGFKKHKERAKEYYKRLLNKIPEFEELAKKYDVKVDLRGNLKMIRNLFA